jgi:hypothetical protein
MAGVVCAADGLTPAGVVPAITNLVTQSLIATDISGKVPSYRLLDTTRVYAFEKLAASGELDRIRRLHAEAIRDLLRQADAEIAAEAFHLNERRTTDWLAEYASQLGNLRAALEWTFSPEGDPALGVALAAASVNFWVANSLLDECCDWAARALSVGGAEGTREEVILRWGVGLALTFSRGMTSRAHDALTKALALSECARGRYSRIAGTGSQIRGGGERRGKCCGSFRGRSWMRSSDMPSRCSTFSVGDHRFQPRGFGAGNGRQARIMTTLPS